MALKSGLFSWASSIARKRDELAKLRAERVKLYNVFPTARQRNKLVLLRGKTDCERVKLNSVFPTPRKLDEAYLRADKERLRLHSIDLNAKVDYKTYLAEGVWAAIVSGAISIPVMYLFGKFLDYKFPVVEEEIEEDMV